MGLEVYLGVTSKSVLALQDGCVLQQEGVQLFRQSFVLATNFL